MPKTGGGVRRLIPVDVESTRGDIHSEFPNSPAQFQRVQEFPIMMQHMKGNFNSIPKHIYILVRVYDVDDISGVENGKAKDHTKMVLLVDPWEYYNADRLFMKFKGHLVGLMV